MVREARPRPAPNSPGQGHRGVVTPPPRDKTGEGKTRLLTAPVSAGEGGRCQLEKAGRERGAVGRGSFVATRAAAAPTRTIRVVRRRRRVGARAVGTEEPCALPPGSRIPHPHCVCAVGSWRSAPPPPAGESAAAGALFSGAVHAEVSAHARRPQVLQVPAARTPVGQSFFSAAESLSPFSHAPS